MVYFWSLTLWIIFAEYVAIVWNNKTVDDVEKSCLVNESKNEITCRGTSQLADLDHFVSSLTLYNWTEDTFDPDVLLPFRKLKNFTICRSSVKLIAKPFNGSLFLQVLNITHTDLETIEPSIFIELSFLKIIDLRFNKLHQFDPSSLINLPYIQAIYLVGNQWHCLRNFSWIVSSNISVIQQYVQDLDLMVCRGPIHNGKPLRQVMIIMKKLEVECSAMQNNCTCKLEHVVRVGSYLRPMITVNCTKLNLTAFPPNLPSFTSTLILRENKISNLQEFIHNEKYFDLLNVYLDYNEISSIDALEGSPWLLNVRALSLKGNNLSEISLHILEDAFNHNHNILNLFLSENPWKCDCGFIKMFKNFLMKYISVIKDVSAIQCSFTESDQTFRVPILGLSKNKVCHESTPSNFSFLTTLNYVMATILIFLFGDFLYNYYKYKKYHKLPWIMSRLSS